MRKYKDKYGVVHWQAPTELPHYRMHWAACELHNDASMVAFFLDSKDLHRLYKGSPAPITCVWCLVLGYLE